MPKTKRLATVQPTHSSQEEHASSPKKKKKKREKEEMIRSPLTSFSSPASSSSSSSKKKKRRREEEEEEEEERVNGEEDRGGKKKKKRRRKEEEEEARKKEEEEEVEESPKKKKKKKKRKKTQESPSPKKEWKEEEEEEEEEEEMKEEEFEEVVKGEEFEEKEEEWPMGMTQKLLDRIAQHIPAPGRDTRSCRVTLKGINWVSVAFQDKSPEACQQHFMSMYRKINPFKTMTMMLGDISSLASSGLRDRRNRPVLPLHRFLKDFFTEETKAAAKEKGEHLLKIGHDAWKNLPADKKQYYIENYNADMSKMRPKPQPLDTANPSQNKDAGSSTTAHHSRKHLASLPTHEQVKIIHQALEEAMKQDADLADYLITNDSGQNDHSPAPTVSKNDLKRFLDAKGCPPLPPTRAPILYMKEMIEKGVLDAVPGNQRVIEAMKLYKELSSKEKAEYKRKLEETLTKFEEDLRVWSQKQDGVTLYALKKYKPIVPYVGPDGKKQKTRNAKTEELFKYRQTALVSCPKFLYEPPRPPPTPYRLFAAKVRSSTDSLPGQELQRTITEGWRGLEEDEKKVYVEKCKSLHQSYESEVTSYVREMDVKTRRLFLGFSRIPLFKFFGSRDIFKAEFPNSEEYPVFVKATDPQASPKKAANDDGNESDNDVLLSSPTAKKRKELSPVIFTSLDLPPTPTKAPNQAPTSGYGRPELGGSSDNTGSVVSKKKTTTTTAPSKSPKKKKKKKNLPSPKEEEEEEEEEDVIFPTPKQNKRKTCLTTTTTAPPHKKKSSSSESESDEEVAPVWKTPVPLSTSQGKKKTTTTTAPSPKKKKADLTEESESEEEITPPWKSPIPPPSKKKTTTTTAPSPKKKKADLTEESESESEEEITPPWKSPILPPSKQKQQKQQKQRESSSSSSGSDSDTS